MKPSFLVRSMVWTTIAAFTSTYVGAAQVDLANVPLVSTSTKVVRPNVFFVLDDSTSMNSEFMPDSTSINAGRRCFWNFGYNRIAYNPNTTYDLPLQANGDPIAYSPSITSARSNGFGSGSGNDLSTVGYGSSVALTNSSFNTTSGSRTVRVTKNNHGLNTGDIVRFMGTPTTGSLRGIPWSNITWTAANPLTFTITRTANNTFTFIATGTTNATSNGTGGATGSSYSTVAEHFYYTHATNPSTCDDDANYTKVLIRDADAAQQLNYARWYSFYRTRLLMMKSAVGRAFVGVDDNFRVGFTTINEKGTDSSRFLDMAKFDAAAKADWYDKLYGQTIPGVQFTPLRGALSKAGRYYAGTLVTGARDPVQYSCQKNFTILTTDGYWNTAGESSNYGPKGVDNSTNVGDQDGNLATSPRPMYDDGHYENTLADVARYYYLTDLRTTTVEGGTNDSGVRTTVNENARDALGNDLPDGHQHMKTITLGLGLNGTLTFPDDEAALKSGDIAWPDPKTSDNTNDGMPERLDDLWHAAVNGDGVYLSAGDAEEVVDALRAALATIQDRDLSGAAAATSSLEPVTGDNFAYVARYTTSKWHGDLQAHTIDLDDGTISSDVEWSAQPQLDSAAGYSHDSRAIYTYNGSSRVPFTVANVNSAYLDSSSSNPNGALSQYAGWNSYQRANATAENMIAYLRGQNQFELQTDATHTEINKRLWRDREHVMGDIVDSSPVYVKKAPFKYADAGYAAFASAQLTRAGTVYVGANDGMLHAFNAETGAERWAYVPRLLHPMLYKLADTNYPANHRFYVNGSLTIGDIFDGTNWKTILVAGLGGGGKGYFALDITDPGNPSVLWEFSHANMGYSYGNPVITKRASDGTWVVLLTSGYNNDSGDGRGRLFMLDASSGSLLGNVATGAGTDPNQSGLAKITAWVLDTLVDNSTQYVYGGDLAGNLWRFDINSMTVQRLGRTSATTGARPLTARPEVARIRDASGNYHRVVFVGTGRYLGAADMTGTSTSESSTQAVFAVKDANTDLDVLTASGANLVAQTLDSSSTPRTIPSPQAVDWTTHNGWFLEVPTGERLTIEPRLQLGTVSFVSNNPVDEYCSTGGSSWLYALDFRSGGAISSQAGDYVGFPVDSHNIGTGLTVVRLPNGKLVAIINTPNGTITRELPTTAAGAGSVRRVGYREIN